MTEGYLEGDPAPHPVVESPEIDLTASIPSATEFESLAKTDPIAFLRASLLRYRKEIHGYRATLVKQERLHGRLGPAETIAVAFRENPFSVLLTWKSAPAGMADRGLYVAGQNDGKTLARGKLMHVIHRRDPYGPDAKAASRYAMPEFGIGKGTERTLVAWQAAKARGNLKVEYLGIKAVPEAGGAECYVLRRTCEPAEEDGVVAVEVSFDTARWLQVANVLTAANDQRIGAYYFRDLVLNPEFPKDQFDSNSLRRD